MNDTTTLLADVERLLSLPMDTAHARAQSRDRMAHEAPRLLRGLRDALEERERDTIEHVAAHVFTQSGVRLSGEPRNADELVSLLLEAFRSDRAEQSIAQEQAEAENSGLRARVARLEAALSEAAVAFENATKYNHREWHLEHEDVEPSALIVNRGLQPWKRGAPNSRQRRHPMKAEHPHSEATSLTPYGWFDEAGQEIPTYDPGISDDVACPVCNGPLTAGPRVTVSFLVGDAGERSYFFRAHRDCWLQASDEQRSGIEGALVIMIARGVQ